MPTSQEALAQLQDFNSKAVAPEQALTQENQSLGVDSAQQKVMGLRTAINNTTSLLNQVAPSVMGRTANSLVTNAQATRMIGNERAPIADQLSEQGRQSELANTDYNMLSDRANQNARMKIEGQNTQRSFLQNIYDNLFKQEKDARDFAESKRQFDVDQANQTARAKAAASAASPSFGGMDELAKALSGGGIPSFAKGTAPTQAIAQLFQGYQPRMKPGYTENVVIPAIMQLYRLNNGAKYSDADYKQWANNLAYRYRKSTFGE